MYEKTRTDIIVVTRLFFKNLTNFFSFAYFIKEYENKINPKYSVIKVTCIEDKITHKLNRNINKFFTPNLLLNSRQEVVSEGMAIEEKDIKV